MKYEYSGIGCGTRHTFDELCEDDNEINDGDSDMDIDQIVTGNSNYIIDIDNEGEDDFDTLCVSVHGTFTKCIVFSDQAVRQQVQRI